MLLDREERKAKLRQKHNDEVSLKDWARLFKRIKNLFKKSRRNKNELDEKDC